MALDATNWEPVEIPLLAEERVADPYTDVDLRATFEHESGTVHEISGFWDGGRTWRVRFAPPEPGRWEYAVEADPAVDGLARTGSLDAGTYRGPNPIKRHGFLETHERHLEHADGTQFFWLGDTVWSAGAKATADEFETYARRRAGQGFNVVQFNTLPQHDASKPQGRLPFGEAWDFDDLRPSYYQSLDAIVEGAYEHGLVPAPVVLWFNYVPATNEDWGLTRHAMTESEAVRYGRYLAARYGAYGPAWLVAGDSDFPDEALDVYRAVAGAVRESVTHPVTTAHMNGNITTPANLNDEDWLDFHCYQSGHAHEDEERAYEYAQACRGRDPTRPVINSEPCYEQHVSFDAEDRRYSREDVRRAAWWSVLGGGNAGISYGGHGLWQWHRRGERFGAAEHIGMPNTWRDALEYPGSSDFALLKTVLSEFSFGALEPRQELVDEHDVPVAELPDDDAILAYVPRSRPLDVAAPVHVAGALWIDPATGREVPADVASGDDGVTVAAPPWTSDAVLIADTTESVTPRAR